MALGGRLNATTWFDRTNYFETVPTGALDFALWLEADRHGRLLAAVNQDNLDNQRDVVKEEKRQRYDNAPYGNALIDVYATVFPDGPPLPPPDDRLDGRPRGGDPGRRPRLLHAPTTGPTTACSPSSATSPPTQGFAAVERYFGPLPRDGHALRPTGPTRSLPLEPPARLERREAGPQRPPAPRLPAARRPHRRVQRGGAGPGRRRRAVLVAARAAAGARRADRDQPRGAHHGVRRRRLARLHHRRHRRRRRPRQGRGGHLRGARRLPRQRPDRRRARVRARRDRAHLAVGAGQPRGAGRPHLPLRGAARRPGIRQHVPGRPRRRDRRAGARRARRATCAPTRGPSSPTWSTATAGAEP